MQLVWLRMQASLPILRLVKIAPVRSVRAAHMVAHSGTLPIVTLVTPAHTSQNCCSVMISIHVQWGGKSLGTAYYTSRYISMHDSDSKLAEWPNHQINALHHAAQICTVHRLLPPHCIFGSHQIQAEYRCQWFVARQTALRQPTQAFQQRHHKGN